MLHTEVVNNIPAIVITIGMAIISFAIKRYLSNQDNRYAEVAKDLKSFSDKFFMNVADIKDSVSEFELKNNVQHESILGKYNNTADVIKRHEEDIDVLQKKVEVHNEKITRLNSKLNS